MACLSVSETSRVLLYSPLFTAKPVLSHGQGYFCECYRFSQTTFDTHIDSHPLSSSSTYLYYLVIHSPVTWVNDRSSFLSFILSLVSSSAFLSLSCKWNAMTTFLHVCIYFSEFDLRREGNTLITWNFTHSGWSYLHHRVTYTQHWLLTMLINVCPPGSCNALSLHVLLFFWRSSWYITGQLSEQRKRKSERAPIP